jgi:heat shock protein beta
MLTDLAEESYEYEDDNEEEHHSEEHQEQEEKSEAAEDDEEDKYDVFWSNFGKNIKLGVIEDSSNRNKLAKLLRFHTTNDEEELTSLDEYISRMKDDQDTILYLPGDSKSAILKSPILKKYTNHGYEVLLLADPIDEFTVQHLSEYEKRKVKSIAKDDVNLFENTDQAKEKQKKLKEMYKPLTDFFKKHLGKQVERVTISNKLEDAPLFILTSQYGYSAQMEKINKNQALANQEKAPSYMLAKKNLELNPSHPVMKHLLEQLKESDGVLPDDQLEYIDLMFQMAMINSGFNIEEPNELTDPLERLIRVGFGVSRDEPCEEIEVVLDEPEVEDEAELEEDPEEIDLDLHDEL